MNKKKDKGACVSCGSKILPVDLRIHPVLSLPQCSFCHTSFLQTGDISAYRGGTERDGSDNFCRCCGDGGDLILCHEKFCRSGFCSECVQRILGQKEYIDISRHGKDWYCFVCDYNQISKLALDRPTKLSRTQPNGKLPDQNGTKSVLKTIQTMNLSGAPELVAAVEPAAVLEPITTSGRDTDHESVQVPDSILTPEPIPVLEISPSRQQVEASGPDVVVEPEATPDLDTASKRAETPEPRTAPESAHYEPAHAERAHVEPAHSEPAHVEPAHSETAHAETAHTDPGHSEPAHSEPAHSEPAHAEPAHAEPAHAEPAHAEPAKPEPAKPEPAHAEPAKPEPAKPEPAKPEPAKPEPAHAEPAHAEPAHPEPPQSEPPHPRPALTESDNPEPAQPEPVHPEPPHLEPAHPEPAHPGSAHTEPAHPEPTHPEPANAEPARPEPVPTHDTAIPRDKEKQGMKRKLPTGFNIFSTSAMCSKPRDKTKKSKWLIDHSEKPEDDKLPPVEASSIRNPASVTDNRGSASHSTPIVEQAERTVDVSQADAIRIEEHRQSQSGQIIKDTTDPMSKDNVDMDAIEKELLMSDTESDYQEASDHIEPKTSASQPFSSDQVKSVILNPTTTASNNPITTNNNMTEVEMLDIVSSLENHTANNQTPQEDKGENKLLNWALKDTEMVSQRAQLFIQSLQRTVDNRDMTRFAANPTNLLAWVDNLRTILTMSGSIIRDCETIFKFRPHLKN